jgi:hypothetical protein
MKKFKVLLLAVIILSAGSFIQQAVAQEKSKAELEKELKLQQLIEEQKKAMIDQKAAREESVIILKEQQEAMDDMLKDLQVKVESEGKAGSTVRVYSPRGGRSFGMDEPYVFSGSGGNFAYFGHSNSDTERTTWDFSKSVKESTFSKDYTFDVEKTAKSVSMSVNGDCKAGEIRIKIIMPNGKSYSEILIDEFGNLNWRKSFSISETENKDKAGEWKFQISSAKATGFFRISLQTN